MLRTIHMGLDGSGPNALARKLALHWAKLTGASVLGHAPVSEPFITEAEAMPMGGAYFQGHRDEAKMAEARSRAQSALDSFSRQCQDAGVACKTVLDVGIPTTLLRQRAETADLTIIARDTFFHFDGSNDPDGVSDEFMHHPPRPVVVAPGGLGSGDAIVAAYDGSPEAARALMAFQSTGLAGKSPVIVVTVREKEEEARPIAQRAVEYLQSHEIAATAKPIGSPRPAGEHLVEELRAAHAQFLVMGAFSHSTLHQFFFGSTTKKVLNTITVPIFLFH